MTNQNFKITTCPFCNSPSKLFLSGADVEDHECTRCGRFLISGTISAHLGGISLTQIQIANISGWIRMNDNPEILSDDLDYIKNLRTPTLGEKAEKFLRYCQKISPIVGEPVKFDIARLNHTYSRMKFFNEVNEEEKKILYDSSKETFILLAQTWTMNPKELSYIIKEYLVNEKGFLKSSVDNSLLIQPKGWEYMEKFTQLNVDQNIGFVAMWFNKKLNTLYDEIIAPAILEAGFNPLRIDRKEHNNKIDDEILVSIQKSRFVVADFTGQRGGVYFEAGYAMGLNIPVIWLCNKEEMENVHFDNRQYNFILWHEDEIGDLKERLKNRIISTIK